MGEEWKSVQALAATVVGASLGGYFVFVCIKNPEQAGAVTLGASIEIVCATLFSLIRGK